MNLLETIMNANGGQNVNALAEQFGLSGEQTQGLLGQLLPVLAKGMQNNVSQEGGLESILGALAGGNHSQYIDDPASLTQPAAVEDGNGILGHLLGGKDASRALAAHAAGNTGISSDLIKQILPVVASMAMGALAQRTSGSNAAANPQDGLMGMLDFNHDGSAMDDVMGIVGKLFSR